MSNSNTAEQLVNSSDQIINTKAMVGKKYNDFSKLVSSEQQQYDLMLANLKSTPTSAHVEKLKKDSIMVENFDTTI